MLFSIKYVHRLKWNGLYQSLMWSCFGIMFMLLYPVSPDLMTFIGGVMLLFQGVPQLIFISGGGRAFSDFTTIPGRVSAGQLSGGVDADESGGGL